MSDYFREQLSIDTPEQVALAFPIAGLGSRLLALLLDSLIQSAAYLVLLLIVALTLSRKLERFSTAPDSEQKWIVAAFIILNFLFFWGYFTLFEAFWNGQTPGKRALKVRVIKDSGRQITFFESMARNFVRIIDALPTAYIVGIISILATRENKRLGDLVAGTIVVRAEETQPSSLMSSHRTITASLAPALEPVRAADLTVEFPQDAIARLSNADLILIESFFARIVELDAPTTERIADQMLAALCHKMQLEKPTYPSARRCLDSIAYSLRDAAIFR